MLVWLGQLLSPCPEFAWQHNPIVVHHFPTCLWQRAVGLTVESLACVAQVIWLVCTDEVV